MRKSSLFNLVTVILILMLELTACGGAQPTPATQGGDDGSTAPTAEVAPEDTPSSVEPTTAPAMSGDKVQVRWFVGLGTGTDPEQIEVEQRIVDEFNASHPNIELIMEVVDYDASRDALATQLASGNPPDIVGPVGVSGAEAFHGQWLDMTEIVESSGYDLSQYDEGAVNFYRSEEEGLVGIPFAIFPSALFYQRDLFDEAGLNYPPHEYGEPYVWADGTEAEWNYETVRELALLLTVDEAGKDATSPDFDPATIEQYGYEAQYQDLRAVGSYFGAGTFVADDGSAQIPPQWAEAWKWLYAGMWDDHFIPTNPVIESEEYGAGNAFNSGRVAMALTHLWYTCCVADAGGNWDVAAVPSHNGQVTSNFNADTFRILKDAKHPAEAFEVLTYLQGEASLELLGIYGGMPARTSDQEAFFAGLNEQYPQEVDWSVFNAGIAYADNPSFEGYMPNYNEAFDLAVTFLSKLRTTEGLEMDTEIEAFKSELQAVFEK